MDWNLSVMVVIALAARNLQNENNNKILLWCACSEGLWGYQALWNAWFAHSGAAFLPHPVFFEMLQWCDPFPPPVQAVSIVTSETYRYTTRNSSLPCRRLQQWKHVKKRGKRWRTWCTCFADSHTMSLRSSSTLAMRIILRQALWISSMLNLLRLASSTWISTYTWFDKELSHLIKGCTFELISTWVNAHPNKQHNAPSKLSTLQHDCHHPDGDINHFQTS